MAFHIVIPARYASSRLPGKPLILLENKPMLAWVYALAQASQPTSITLATDDERIVALGHSLGATVMMTRADHLSGTDRLAEVVARQAWPDEAVIVNVQGDEPLLPSHWVRQVAKTLHESTASLATLATPFREVAELMNPNSVKVVMNAKNEALYFSRAPIPYDRDDGGIPKNIANFPDFPRYWRHIGLYAYRAGTLRQWPQLAVSSAERAESLEQLRALHHGLSIVVATTTESLSAGVDVPEDIPRVERLLREKFAI